MYLGSMKSCSYDSCVDDALAARVSYIMLEKYPHYMEIIAINVVERNKTKTYNNNCAQIYYILTNLK